MRYLATFFVAVALGGCHPDSKGDLAACELEALKVYPSDGEFISAKKSIVVGLCMDARGYTFDTKIDKCSKDKSFMPFDVECYRPRSIFSN